jgi:hypothetical protein
MKKYFCLAIIILFNCLNITGAKASTNKVIRNCIDLQNIQNDLGASYIMVNNINCADTINWNGGEGFRPLGSLAKKFSGSLDGRGYTISNLHFDTQFTSNVGLFSYIDSAHIKNLKIDKTSITGLNNVALIANANNSTVSNIDIRNTIIHANEYTATFSVNFDGPQSSCSNINIYNTDINILHGHAAGFVAVSVDSQNIYNISVKNINIVNDSNGAYSLAGAIGYTFNVKARDLFVDDISIATVSTIGNIAGAVDTLDAKSMLSNLHATNININSQDFIAGLINNVIDSRVDNATLNHASITGEDYVSGVIREIKTSSVVKSIKAQNIKLNAEQNNSGFLNSLVGSAISNCHLSNLDFAFTKQENAGFIDYMANSNVDKCSLTHSRMTSEDSGIWYNGGFVHGLYDFSNITNCYIDSLDMLIDDGRSSAIFAQHVQNNVLIENCYIVNSLFDAHESGDISAFIQTANTDITINNCYTSAELEYAWIGGKNYSFIQNPSGTITTNNCYYNQELLSDFAPDYASALNTVDFADFTNTTALDPNIWYLNTDNFPALKGTEFDLGSDQQSEFKILPPQFTSFYDRLSRGSLVTDLSLSNNLNNSDFDFEILDTTKDAKLFYIDDQKLYTNKVFYYDQGNQYQLEIKARNANSQFLTMTLNLKVLQNPFFRAIDENPIEENEGNDSSDEDETILEDSCESNIKNYLGFNDDQAIKNIDLVNLIFDLNDITSSLNNDSTIAELLSCDTIKPKVDNIKQELNLLGLNKRGRLNFSAYRNYVRRFKRLLKKDDTLTCENLQFDHDTNCALDMNDFQFYKDYFKSSIERRASSLAVERKLRRIDNNLRLARFL